MAGRYGPTSVTIGIEDGPGGTTRAMAGFITSGFEVGHEAETAETTAFGDSFREHVPTGLKTHDDLDLTCIFDTTATTGTHAVLGTVDDGPQDDTREIVVVVGDSKTYTFDAYLVKYHVVMALDNIQMVNVVLRPSGAGVWS